MSRQKKLLVITGDADLALSEIGREAVPALYDFCRICGDKGSIQ